MDDVLLESRIKTTYWITIHFILVQEVINEVSKLKIYLLNVFDNESKLQTNHDQTSKGKKPVIWNVNLLTMKDPPPGDGEECMRPVLAPVWRGGRDRSVGPGAARPSSRGWDTGCRRGPDRQPGAATQPGHGGEHDHPVPLHLGLCSAKRALFLSRLLLNITGRDN